MDCATGIDVFYVQDTGDQVFETIGEGNDRIAASVSFALPSGSEVETIEIGRASCRERVKFAGSEVAQNIIGNNGANFLDGGGGNDVLVVLGGNHNMLAVSG